MIKFIKASGFLLLRENLIFVFGVLVFHEGRAHLLLVDEGLILLSRLVETVPPLLCVRALSNGFEFRLVHVLEIIREYVVLLRLDRPAYDWREDVLLPVHLRLVVDDPYYLNRFCVDSHALLELYRPECSVGVQIGEQLHLRCRFLDLIILYHLFLPFLK